MGVPPSAAQQPAGRRESAAGHSSLKLPAAARFLFFACILISSTVYCRMAATTKSDEILFVVRFEIVEGELRIVTLLSVGKARNAGAPRRSTEWCSPNRL